MIAYSEFLLRCMQREKVGKDMYGTTTSWLGYVPAFQQVKNYVFFFMPAGILVNCNCFATGHLCDTCEICHNSLMQHIELTGTIKLIWEQSDAYLLTGILFWYLCKVKCLLFSLYFVLFVFQLLVSVLIQ